jgi:hypothetical protein
MFHNNYASLYTSSIIIAEYEQREHLRAVLFGGGYVCVYSTCIYRPRQLKTYFDEYDHLLGKGSVNTA